MLASLEGLDHVVVMVRNLDDAAGNWRSLGFTLSPRGTHSPHLGTGNYTIMFDVDYLELLGIVQDTELNAPSRAFLEQHGEGIERAAFTSSDATTGVAALRARGIDAQGPIEFSRPVELPGGGHGEATFSVFHWPAAERAAELRIFACQHHTRGTVWIPALQTHPNTATGIVRIELVSGSPGEAARQLARLIDGEALESGADSARVDTAPGRAGFLFLTHEAFLARHPSARRDALPDTGAAALVLRVKDLDAAARTAGAGAVIEPDSVTVAADRANGVMLVFERA
jgi:Glyoxalase-like domain